MTTQRQWWSELELGRKLDVLLAATILPVLILTLVMGTLTNRVNNRTVVVSVYRNTVFDLADLQIAMLNIETGYRGYALSNNRTFLEPYTSGQRAAAEALQSLKGRGVLRLETERVAEEVQSYQRWVEATIKRIETSEALPKDLQNTLFVEGKGRFDSLRRSFDALGAKALGAFEEQRGANTRDLAQINLFPWIILSILLVTAALSRFGLSRWAVEPIKRLQAATQQLARGDNQVRLAVHTRDEIGQLERLFNETAEILEQRETELKRSNHELEQFAYVASHDLQEPLRMVSSYTQLLGKRYRGKLDEKADSYIHYATDGANRMQALIQDLLTYSRVGTREAPLVSVDAGAVVRDVLQSLEIAVQESQAQFEVGPLPTVLADRVQLGQVFQNLIGNALKFRRSEVQHQVSVTATRDGEFWHFEVRDNGIGIESEYFDRVFIIFQRLHTRETFAGSGIGLAICKKIIERHGGRIWVESQPDQGSSFHFTLLAAPQ